MAKFSSAHKMKTWLLVSAALALITCGRSGRLAEPQLTAERLSVSSFPGITVGEKLATAQRACNGPCVLEIGPKLASQPHGTMPQRCKNCTWISWSSGRMAEVSSSRVNVLAFGARADGVADDTDAIEGATAAVCDGDGGVLYFPGGVYKLTRAIRLIGSKCSNVTIEGDGFATTLLFEPHAPIEVTINDRVFYIESEVSAAVPIVERIAGGDRSFVAHDSSDLRTGEWLVVFERDPGVNDIVITDWVQVASVTKSRVEIQHPFRTSFPRAREWILDKSGLGFYRLHSLLENVEVRRLKIAIRKGQQSLVGINIGMALRTHIREVVIDNGRGNGFAIYRAKDISIQNVAVTNSLEQANEVAASIDLRIANSSFGFQRSGASADAADTAALSIDFGTAFFTITGNTFHSAGNIAVMLLNGVHDGSFTGNAIGWTRDSGIGRGQGLSSKGSQRLLVHGNSFAGGDRGTGNTCITFEDSSGLRVPIMSSGNIITSNVCANFSHETGARLKADKYD